MKLIQNSLKPYYKSTLQLAGPIVISQLGHTLVHMCDSIIVGHFAGTIPFAAVSLVNASFMIIMVIGLGIAYGITPLIAKFNGTQNFKECAVLLSNSLWLNIFFGLLLFAVIMAGSFFGLEHMKQDPEVVKQAKPYLFILGLSIIPLMIFSAFKQFAEGLGFTKQAMNITIWGNVLNIILAIILVKGMFGIPPMGVKGVGISTLVDRILMMAVMGYYVLTSKNFKKYTAFFNIWKVSADRIKSILKIGAPVAMQYVFEIGAFAGASIMAGMISAISQAAHQVAIQLASMTYMMAGGIASAATIKIGNQYGLKKYDRLRKYATASYHLVLIFMIFTASIFALCSKLLPYIFTSDLSVVMLASQLLILAGLFQLFDGTQVVGLGILRGIGDVNKPTIITFIAYWVIALPFGYLSGIYFGWGVQGIWYGLTFGLLASSVLLYWRYRRVENKLEQS